jgi:hypothetical protein
MWERQEAMVEILRAKGASRKTFRDAKDPLRMTGYCCLWRRNGKSKRDSSLRRLRLE